MAKVGMHEAKSNLSKLVERVEGGEEIVITRRGTPAARLVPARRGEGFASLAGTWRGRVRIADDFDELPDDLAESLGTRP
ncbi:MAG TPA: type II toxin-antitoxin system prevent-host-death family antitoxin [Solirubrobacterales bacterium]|nr:type II toxin-antitoxin system prevent-host-death family antitoxin [Solirubrobacterales bacterium]